jgi:hypothetical protein
VIGEEVRYAGYPEILTVGAKLWGLLFGINLDEHRPIDAVVKIGSRRLMIVHGLSDDRVQPHHALDFAQAREKAVGNGHRPRPRLVPGARARQAAFAAPTSTSSAWSRSSRRPLGTRGSPDLPLPAAAGGVEPLRLPLVRSRCGTLRPIRQARAPTEPATMSFLRRLFGGADALPAGVPTAGAPVASTTPAAASAAETATVRKIVAKLEALPPDRARLLAGAAYVVSRAAMPTCYHRR